MKAAYLLTLTALLILATSMGVQGWSHISEGKNPCDCESPEAQQACPHGHCACWPKGDTPGGPKCIPK
uniref:Hypothetical secreted peptide n=1 Tax=Rhipicephalus sanguineus TaxID=34632 RepID=C9W1F1_RHISA